MKSLSIGKYLLINWHGEKVRINRGKVKITRPLLAIPPEYKDRIPANKNITREDKKPSPATAKAIPSASGMEYLLAGMKYLLAGMKYLLAGMAGAR